MLCLFILVADSDCFQGLKRALDNQFLLDTDAYPTTMPKALKLLEKVKSEVGTTPKGHAYSGDDYGVAFVQAQIWAHSMLCHHCGVKGQGVDNCPNLTHDQRRQFWGDRNNSRREKYNTA